MEAGPVKKPAFSVSCPCGKKLGLPKVQSGRRLTCPTCKQGFSVIGREIGDSTKASASLKVCHGPQSNGDWLYLVGKSAINVGKQPGSDLLLVGERVSRAHCRLVPTDAGWQIEDNKSTNGLFVNDERVASHHLEAGDVIRIGDFELEYSAGKGSTSASSRAASADTDDIFKIAEDDLFSALAKGQKVAPVREEVAEDSSWPTDARAASSKGSLTCPSCRKLLPGMAKICVNCGINVETGRPILISQESNLDETYEAAEKTITVVSWLLPTGVFPIASEAFGTRKPYAVRALALLTVVVSLYFIIGEYAAGKESTAFKEAMLWAGDPTVPRPELRGLISLDDAETDDEEEGAAPSEPERPSAEVDADKVAAKEAAAQNKLIFPDGVGKFQSSQLITHAFLHGGFMHLIGNLIFFLVFGSRVNALLGNLATLAVYPILAVGAGLFYAESMSGHPVTPMLGASGAVMGLAGMYLVLFPVNKVHMAAWARLLWTGFQLRLKLWAVRGFWVVLFYIGFDVLFTVLKLQDGVAHWAHLGGFITGVLVALLLLMTRQFTARGSDIFSMILGKYSWTLIGKPNREPGFIQRSL